MLIWLLHTPPTSLRDLGESVVEMDPQPREEMKVAMLLEDQSTRATRETPGRTAGPQTRAGETLLIQELVLVQGPPTAESALDLMLTAARGLLAP